MHDYNAPPKDEHPKMSIEECREYLHGIDLTDEELERIRDALYDLVRKVFDEKCPW